MAHPTLTIIPRVPHSRGYVLSSLRPAHSFARFLAKSGDIRFPSVSPCLSGELFSRSHSGNRPQLIFKKPLDVTDSLTPPALACSCQGATEENLACGRPIRLFAPTPLETSHRFLPHTPSYPGPCSLPPGDCRLPPGPLQPGAWSLQPSPVISGLTH